MTDKTKAKTYNLKFQIYNTFSPGNVIDSDPFIVHVVNPCDPHLDPYDAPTLAAPSFTTTTYYIGTAAKTYVMPHFTVDPIFCESEIVYTFDPATDSDPSIIDSDGNSGAVFVAGTRTFTYSTQDPDLSTPDTTGTTYALTVTATLPDVSVSTTGDVPVIFKNPCFDSNYLQVITRSQPNF